MDTDELTSRCEELSGSIVRVATDAGLCISTAESCTAGMVASFVADVPGASSVLRGGAVTYCDEIKHRVLGVPASTLERYSAVSEQTACAMARGSLELFGSDVAVSVTGYAGPGGGTAEDPVGTVYIGVATQAAVRARRCSFEGDRASVRLQATLHTLEIILEVMGECGVSGE